MNIEIANKLLQLRKKNGLSQEELAEKLGLSRQAISKWERAEASPDTDNLIALAKIYNISLDKLFEIDATNTLTIDKVKSERSHISLKKEADEVSEPAFQEDKMPDGFREKSSDIGMRIKYPEGSMKNVKEKYPEGNSKSMREKYPETSSQSIKEKYPQSQDTSTASQTVTQKSTSDQSSYNYNYNYNYSYQEPEQKQTMNFETVPDNNQAFQPSVLSENKGLYKALMTFPYPLVITALYLFAGAFLRLWHPGWMMFLTIPLYYTTIEAIRKKDLNIFCFPVLVTMFYLIIGFAMNLWHPGWISFMAIPFYYWLINIKKGK